MGGEVCNRFGSGNQERSKKPRPNLCYEVSDDASIPSVPNDSVNPDDPGSPDQEELINNHEMKATKRPTTDHHQLLHRGHPND